MGGRPKNTGASSIFQCLTEDQINLPASYSCIRPCQAIAETLLQNLGEFGEKVNLVYPDSAVVRKV